MTFPVIFMRTTTQPDWTEAACHSDDYDPDLWFTDNLADQTEAIMAVSVCNRCPIAGDCLSYALEAEIEWGIWGGLTARQRMRFHGDDPLREQRKVAASLEKLLANGMKMPAACAQLGISEGHGYRMRKLVREAGHR